MFKDDIGLRCIANVHNAKMPYKYLYLYPLVCMSLGYRGSYVLCVNNDSHIYDWLDCLE